MKKQLVIAGAVVLLLSIVLSGCNQEDHSSNNNGNHSFNSEKARLIGSWVNKTSFGLVTAINLFSDNTSVFNTLSGFWGLNEGKLVITFNGGLPASYLTFNYEFFNNNGTLLLTALQGSGSQLFTKNYTSGNGDENTFVGTWVNVSTIGTVTTRHFFSNGASIIDEIPSTWNLLDGKLVIRLDTNTSWVYNYVFSDSNSILSLTSVMGGVTQVFTKE